jgi:hypothetical protein
MRLVLVVSAVLLLVGLAGRAVYASSGKPGLALSASPSNQSVPQGQTTTYSITATGSNGFAGTLPLSVSGLPAGTMASFASPAVVVSKSVPTVKTTLSVTTSTTTPAGTSTLVVATASGSTTASITAALTVTGSLAGSFALSSAPSALSASPGLMVATTVKVARTAPFAGAVALTTGSLPAGVTGSFNPSSTPATTRASSSTLRLATSSSTNVGTYAVTVFGTYVSAAGQRYTASSQLQLVVAKANPSKPFTLSGNISQPLAPGSAAQPIDLAISNPNNQPLPVTNLSTTLNGTSAGQACDNSNFAVTQYSGPYPLTVPAAATSTLSDLRLPSSTWPRLQMLNLPHNQDACKDVAVSLGYAGTARGN